MGPNSFNVSKFYWLFLLICFSGCNISEWNGKKVYNERPNIILLLTDDHRADALGYAGNTIIQTPQLDQLAREGIYFKNAYVTTSVCAVSRASYFSGQYARRHGIQDFSTSFTKEAFAKTYPALLRQSGYCTGFIGKYGVGNELPVQEFDQWFGFSKQGTYNHQDAEGNYQHLTSLIGDQTENFLEQVNKENPFCISVSFKAPHVEGLNTFIPDPHYDNLYMGDEIPTPLTGGDAYFERFPDFFKINNEGRARWQARFSTPALYQENVKKYYRLITGVDDVVGRIRNKLLALDIDQNTIIIFASDNGFYLGEHGLAGKWFGHEESIRIPMIIYDPRLPKRKREQTIDDIVLNIDVAPTILSMAGLQAPETMQGMDITKLINKSNPDWRHDFFYEHLFDYNGRISKTEGVVGQRYKYLRYLDPDPDHEVIYDIEADPFETENFAGSPQYTPTLQELRSRWELFRNTVE